MTSGRPWDRVQAKRELAAAGRECTPTIDRETDVALITDLQDTDITTDWQLTDATAQADDDATDDATDPTDGGADDDASDADDDAADGDDDASDA